MLRGTLPGVRVPRRAARLALALLVSAALALRLWEADYYLPNVFYSDFVQIDQAAEFLREGSFTERSSYPVTHTYFYAAADCVAYAGGRATGRFPSWEAFVDELASKNDPSLRHLLGRVYTAFLGAFTVAAVYRMARCRFDRKVALLAAALLAFSPAHVVYGHQPRIHVPGIFFLCLAAIPVLRAGGPGLGRRAALAGAAAAASASIFQLGYFLVAAVAGLFALATVRRERSLGATARLAAAFAGAFAGALALLYALGHLPGVVQMAKGHGALENVGTLGIPTITVSGVTLGRFAERFPWYLAHFVASEPFVAFGSLAFALSMIWRRDRRAPFVAYGIYPLVATALLGTTYTEVRYTLSLTPFLGVFAAAALLSLRPAWLRWALVAAALLVPLASSARYAALLRRADSRIVLHENLPKLASATIRTTIDSALVLPPPRLAPGVVQFPPDGDYAIWPPIGKERPAQTLRRCSSQIFVGIEGSGRTTSVSDGELDDLRYKPWGGVPGCVPGRAFLPDASDWLLRDLWYAARCGPPIEIWVRTPAAHRLLDDQIRDPRVVRIPH